MAIPVADTYVRVAADMSAYNKTLKEEGLKGAQSLAQSIKNALSTQNLGTAAVPQFSNLGNIKAFVTDLRAGKVGMAGLRDEAAILGPKIRTAFSAATLSVFHAGLSGVKNVLSGLGGVLSSIGKGFSIGLGIGSFQALGRAISDVVEFIPNLVDRGRDYGNMVDQIADSTGATAEASSRLAGTLQFLGAPIGSIVNLLGQMSRNLDENADALKAAGVATEDANGGLLNQVQILENARRAFQAFGDGTTKAKAIALEFGRGGLAILVDYLKLTDEQANKITADLQAQGLIISESQRNMAETAQREGNRFQNALTGLGTTLFTIVGPQITAFFSNLSDTITAHATEISNAIGQAVSYIIGLVSSLVGISDSMDSFSGGIENASGVTSPYSAKLLQLNVQLADLTSKQKTATDTGEAQRKGIQRQIDAVTAEITALDKLEKQQDKTYKKALAGVLAVLGAQEQLLDAEDKAAQRAQTDLDLTERLRQAKIDLFEAQAQLRADAIAGVSPDQDTLDIQDRTRAVLDAQKAISEEARNRAEDDRRAEITATKTYIESIQKLLEDADNKKAALNTLRRREAVLEARRTAQLAAGDTTGAGDTLLKLEAIRTTETRAQEEVRNGIKRSALETQKSLLEDEKAAIKSLTVDANAAAIERTKTELAELAKQQAAWDRLTDRQKAQLTGVSEQITGKGGLSDAFRDARDAGVDMGDKIKAAFAGLAQTFADIATSLGDINKYATVIADLITLARLGSVAGGVATLPFNVRGDVPPEAIPGNADLLAMYKRMAAAGRGSEKVGNNETVDQAIKRLSAFVPSHAAGLWNSLDDHLAFIHKREMVLPPAIADVMRARPLPSFALAGGSSGPDSGTLVVEKLTIDFGDRAVDLLNQKLAYRRRRG